MELRKFNLYEIGVSETTIAIGTQAYRLSIGIGTNVLWGEYVVGGFAAVDFDGGDAIINKVHAMIRTANPEVFYPVGELGEGGIFKVPSAILMEEPVVTQILQVDVMLLQPVSVATTCYIRTGLYHTKEAFQWPLDEL